MPYVKVYIHFVWSTKNRHPHFDSRTLRLKIWKHIRENASLKGIKIDCINGYTDHCHCLISLNPNQTMIEVMKLIKGESAYWINKERLTKEYFEWQDEYFATAVSESIIKRTQIYIKNQEAHHEKKTFHHELNSFLNKCGFSLHKE